MNRKRGSTREPLSGGGVGDAGPDGTGDGDAVASQTDDGRLVHVAPVAAGGRPSTRDMLVAAAIGVAGSLVVVPLTYLQVFAGIAHVYLVAATLGLWFLQCVVPLIVVRKPGASLIACLAMGVVSAATTPFGVAAIGALIMEGLLIELPFMVTLYRRWTRTQFVASAMLFSALMGTMAPRAVGVDSPTTPMTLISFAIALASSLVFWSWALPSQRGFAAAGSPGDRRSTRVRRCDTRDGPGPVTG